MEMSGSVSKEEEEEEDEAMVKRGGGAQKRKKKRTGVVAVFQGQHPLGTLLVLLLMAGIVKGNDNETLGQGRFRITSSCYNDEGCRQDIDTLEREATLIVIGKDTEAETQRVLENGGLWSTLKWRRLYHFIDYDYLTKNLTEDQGDLHEKVLDLSKEWASDVNKQKTNAKDCYCKPLVDELGASRIVVFLFFNDANCTKKKTEETYCKNRFPEGLPENTKILVGTKDVDIGRISLPNSEGGHNWKAVRYHISHTGFFKSNKTDVINPFRYIPNALENGTELLNARRIHNKFLMNETVGKDVILDPICLAEFSQCDGANANCTNMQAAPRVDAEDRIRQPNEEILETAEDECKNMTYCPCPPMEEPDDGTTNSDLDNTGNGNDREQGARAGTTEADDGTAPEIEGSQTEKKVEGPEDGNEPEEGGHINATTNAATNSDLDNTGNGNDQEQGARAGTTEANKAQGGLATWAIIVIVVVILVTAVIILVACCWFYRKRMSRPLPATQLTGTPPPTQASTVDPSAPTPEEVSEDRTQTDGKSPTTAEVKESRVSPLDETQEVPNMLMTKDEVGSETLKSASNNSATPVMDAVETASATDTEEAVVPKPAETGPILVSEAYDK